jgi:hypothetical protein
MRRQSGSGHVVLVFAAPDFEPRGRRSGLPARLENRSLALLWADQHRGDIGLQAGEGQRQKISGSFRSRSGADDFAISAARSQLPKSTGGTSLRPHPRPAGTDLLASNGVDDPMQTWAVTSTIDVRGFHPCRARTRRSDSRPETPLPGYLRRPLQSSPSRSSDCRPTHLGLILPFKPAGAAERRRARWRSGASGASPNVGFPIRQQTCTVEGLEASSVPEADNSDEPFAGHVPAPREPPGL